MRYVVIGAVESTQVCLRSIAEAGGLDVAAIVTLPPSLAHRHSDFVDLSPHAVELRARLLTVTNSNAPALADELAAIKPDYLLVIGWSQLIGESLRAVPRRGAIGLHPTPLPRLRGRAPIPWTILLDEKITGTTLFWLDDRADSGPILAQRFHHVAPDETATSLIARQVVAMRELFLEVIPQLEAGTAPSQPQDERYATWCAKRVPADGRIDWREPAVSIWRLVRAVTKPYPGAFTFDPDGQLILWTAAPLPCPLRQAALPGQVISRTNTSFIVRCGDGNDLDVMNFTDKQGSARPAPRLHVRLGLVSQ